MKKLWGFFLVFLFVLSNSCKPLALNGDKAYKHLLKFSLIGNRALVTQSEKNSRYYIKSSLDKMGYKTKMIKFNVEGYETYNIEANKKGNDSSQVIIIGAHYDGRIEGNAFDDNGSGISILLELCEIFKDIRTPYDIKFIFFGAEEINVLGNGLHGSYDYLESLSEKEKSRIKYMINLDTLVSGDEMYVYNIYKDEKIEECDGTFLNRVKELSENMNIDLNFNSPDNENISFTNTKSDYYPFFEAGIPVLYFESTNWSAGESDGRSQTEQFGRIIHTPKDNMTFIENFFNNRIKERLKDYVSLIKEFVLLDV